MLATTATLESGGTTDVDPISRVTELVSERGAVGSCRVSSTRVGVIGTKSPTLSSGAVPSVNQPATSATRSTPPEVNRETLPSVETGTIARFARVSPPDRLRFDTTGRSVPAGQTVTKPPTAAWSPVTLSTTADTPLDGTGPRPVT